MLDTSICGAVCVILIITWCMPKINANMIFLTDGMKTLI